MNYQKIYDQIIERAKTRVLEGYKEKHHIIPRCLGGGNEKENIIELTAREHFLCHMLLCEIYPNHNKLRIALYLMSINKNKKEEQKYVISSRIYERLKKLYKVTWGDKISKSLKGKLKHTDESKKKIGNGNLGKQRTQESKDKISLNSKGIKKHSDIFKEKISKIHKGKKVSQNTRDKQSSIKKGKICSELTKNKMSLNHSNLIYTEERNNKISKSMLGKLKSEEHKNNLRIARTGVPTKKGISIIQYDLDGNFIKEWNKIEEAQVFLNLGGIGECCKGKYKRIGQFMWKYKSENYPLKIEPYKLGKLK